MYVSEGEKQNNNKEDKTGLYDVNIKTKISELLQSKHECIIVCNENVQLLTDLPTFTFFNRGCKLIDNLLICKCLSA